MYEFYPICLLTSAEPGKYMFVFKVLVGHLSAKAYPKTAILCYCILYHRIPSFAETFIEYILCFQEMYVYIFNLCYFATFHSNVYVCYRCTVMV